MEVNKLYNFNGLVVTTLYLFRSRQDRHPIKKTLEYLWYVISEQGTVFVVFESDLKEV